jgi:hypothetical protein
MSIYTYVHVPNCSYQSNTYLLMVYRLATKSTSLQHSQSNTVRIQTHREARVTFTHKSTGIFKNTTTRKKARAGFFCPSNQKDLNSLKDVLQGELLLSWDLEHSPIAKGHYCYQLKLWD